MISNQVLQSTIDSIKGIARLDIAIADIDGKVLATTFVEDRDLSGMVVSFADFSFLRFLMSISWSLC